MSTLPTDKYPDFIDGELLGRLARESREDSGRVRAAISRALAKEPLTVEETAGLLAAESQDLQEEIFAAARQLKREVYGNRIVIFAPLYIGNLCINDCLYCAFRRTQKDTIRRTLSDEELRLQVEALEDAGHKRLILVFGEHPDYSPEFIANAVRTTYSVKKGRGTIRRVNINAAPLDHQGYRTVKESGIGTYQVFQESYHRPTYQSVHPAGTRKADYLWRLHGLTRAWEAGCDDVGIGALFGLYDWKFEVLGLVTHARFLADRFGCGPHTISFPRLRMAQGFAPGALEMVSDPDFKRLVAILRLAVPYTGMILTAREPAAIRREVMEFGVSQIDAGTRIELAGYTKEGPQELKREQFEIGDSRSLDEIVGELLNTGYIPSFCTACYRLGRTGVEFMEYAVPGFIRNFCTPNALLTLAEYLEDYASEETRRTGDLVIGRETAKLADPRLNDRLTRIRSGGERDLYF